MFFVQFLELKKSKSAPDCRQKLQSRRLRRARKGRGGATGSGDQLAVVDAPATYRQPTARAALNCMSSDDACCWFELDSNFC
jgi:hypothetical protein